MSLKNIEFFNNILLNAAKYFLLLLLYYLLFSFILYTPERSSILIFSVIVPVLSVYWFARLYRFLISYYVVECNDKIYETLSKTGIDAKAEILDLKETHCYQVVVFKYLNKNGKTYVIKNKIWDLRTRTQHGYEVGHSANIKYDPKNPRLALVLYAMDRWEVERYF